MRLPRMLKSGGRMFLSLRMVSLAVMLCRSTVCLGSILVMRSRFLMRVFRHDYLLSRN